MKVTPRRQRSDSAAAAIAATQAAALGPLEPPAHVTLRPGDRPFWNAIMLARARPNRLDVTPSAGRDRRKQKCPAHGRAFPGLNAGAACYSTPSISAAWRCRRAMRRSVGGWEALAVRRLPCSGSMTKV